MNTAEYVTEDIELYLAKQRLMIDTLSKILITKQVCTEEEIKEMYDSLELSHKLYGKDVRFTGYRWA